MKRFVQFVALVFFSGGCFCQASMIADWTFETSQPGGSGTTVSGIIAEEGVNAAISSASGHHADPATGWTSVAGDGSVWSFSGNHWSEADYFQFATSTTGFKDITIGFEQTSSGTGPSAFKLAYSTDGTSYFDVPGGDYAVDSISWSKTGSPKATILSFDLASMVTINNRSTVFFRLIDTSGLAAGGGAVGPSGTSRIDDFTISGVAMVPEPGSGGLISGTVLLVLCGFCLWRRHLLRSSLSV